MRLENPATQVYLGRRYDAPKARRWRRGCFSYLVGILILFLALWWIPDFELGYVPDAEDTLNTETSPSPAYDLFGIPVSEEMVQSLQQNRPELLSPQQGAVKIDEELLRRGREAFYTETFGNEVFLTDVLGLVSGGVGLKDFAEALWQLGGKGTTDLLVTVPETVTVGGKTFEKESVLHTGIDVPKGSYMPLGMVTRYNHGRIQVGISCALCHSTVDPVSLKVVHGAPNIDINSGVLLALASNSAAYFTHAETGPFYQYTSRQAGSIRDASGNELVLPDIQAFEDAVDRIFVQWPPGNFDSTTDRKADPTQIPDSFTVGDHPFGWSGFAMGGPFRGLSALNNYVHGQNSDSLPQSQTSLELFGIPTEVYIAAILQNAPYGDYRYDPASGVLPSAFMREIDPTPGAPGFNELILPPTFPQTILTAPDGAFISEPGRRAWESVHGMSAWQDSLKPPAGEAVAEDVLLRGRQVFEESRCVECHSGPAYSNFQILSATDIQTEPARAKAFAKTQLVFEPQAVMFPPDTPVPLPKDAQVIPVPTDHLDPRQIEWALAYNGSPGGYKVPSLIGLRWSAPYLHDGGVAVGPDAQSQWGLPGTVLKQIVPDPANSLLALIDRRLREAVIQANDDASLLLVHSTGEGHGFWVDEEAGFSTEDQKALIQFLLNIPVDVQAIHDQIRSATPFQTLYNHYTMEGGTSR